MAEEKILTVPLRRDFINVSKNRRANKAVDSLRTFLSVHNKVSKEKVKISRSINEFLWRRGAQKPPSRVKVLVSFDGEFLKAMLPEEKQKPKKEEKPKETKPEKEKQEPAKEAKEKAKPEKESTEKKEAKKQVSEKLEQPAEAKDKKQEKKQ
ncbi:MAG: hypothetical protein DRP18_02135 [Candidatus Aenigmatarchaeota archaeon]|nr:MAG: hypothetical protein DRP18_02135 [Candidatus Aenigmarchaeota archaeon]